VFTDDCEVFLLFFEKKIIGKKYSVTEALCQLRQKRNRNWL